MILLATDIVVEPLRNAPRVLPFDLDCTPADTASTTRARSAGRAVAAAGGHIVAVAATHALAVATRDTSPFKAAGVAVIDPWAA